MSPCSVLVTGTDTGVGKTVVAAGLVAWLARAGVAVRPLKPVESGTDDFDGVPADTDLLARCAGVARDDAGVLALPEPLAPVVAARRAGVVLEIAALDRRVRDLLETGATVVVEGVGGALVEVAEGTFVADLPKRWGLPAIVVAGNRLGVLSHTLLTVEALQARGARVLAVVLNTLSPEPPSVAERTNAAELRRTLPRGVALLGPVPYVPEGSARDPLVLAEALAPVAATIFGDP